MFKIKKIHFSDTYSIRKYILRPEKTIESCFFEGDDFLSTLHYGIFEGNILIGVVSLFESKNNLVILAAIAVLPELIAIIKNQLLNQLCTIEHDRKRDK